MNKTFLPQSEFGNTDLKVTILGLGAAEIGNAKIPEKDAELFLNRVLDMGITMIDTARGYELSEERIGRYIGHRRKEYVLSTKVGYDVPGTENWTYECVKQGIEMAMKKLKTDILDIVHLHTCSKEILVKGDVIKALEEAREAGKIRCAAYSGENEALVYAIECGRFHSLQTSVNIFDQRDIDTILPTAAQKGMGIIAKRPVANTPWKYEKQPVGLYAEEYWKRMKKLNLDAHGLSLTELALRFVISVPEVNTSITGSTNFQHLQENIEILKKGPLPPDLYQEIKKSFQDHDDNWIGMG